MNSAELARVAAIARAQAGVISKAQFLAARLSATQWDRFVVGPSWKRAGRGVGRSVTAAQTFEQRVWTACLESGGWASHRTAGWLWGLDGIARFAPQRIEVLVELTNRRRARHAHVRRSRTLVKEHLSTRPGPPCTSLERTLLDLAEVLDGDALELAYSSAVRKQPNFPATLRALLDPLPRRGHRGIAELRSLLEEGSRPLDSALEVKVMRLLKRAKVPKPEVGHMVFDGDVHVAKLDFAWPSNRPRVALMAHGARFHHNTDRWERDLDQMTVLNTIGWRVLQFSYRDVTRRPKVLLERVRRALSGYEASGEWDDSR